MDRLFNAIKGHAAGMDQQGGQPSVGVVSAYDPASHTARVTFFKDVEGAEYTTGPLPIITPGLGNGWGLKVGLEPGQQVAVIRDTGDADHPIIVGGLYSARAQPPQTLTTPEDGAPSHVQGQELALVHHSGACIRLSNDGNIYMQAPNVLVLGDLRVKGDVYDAHGSLDRLRGHYNSHGHPDASAPPGPIDPE